MLEVTLTFMTYYHSLPSEGALEENDTAAPWNSSRRVRGPTQLKPFLD